MGETTIRQPQDLGCTIATEIAREMVMFLRRPGGQARISPVLKLQMTDYDPSRELQTWIFERLHLPLTVEDLALQVHMSPRNFARAFVSQVGVTPARFIESIRLDAARRRLEETDRSLEQIASECGFGSAETMRRSFVRNLRTPPSAYRAQVQSA
jgi:transcriptional regulator GlxA family with amidase domain